MKKIFTIILIFYWISLNGYAADGAETEQFKKSGAYDTFKITEEYFEGFDSISILEGFLEGKPFDEKGILKEFFGMVFSHSASVTKSFMYLIIIGVIISFLTNTCESLNGNTNTSAGIVGYIIFSSALITFFYELISPAQSAISDLTIMSKSLFAILISSVYLSGGMVTTGLMQNVMSLVINIISEVVNELLFPLILVSMVISTVGNMSDNFKIDNFIKMSRSFVKWCVGFLMIFFVGLMGIYGITGSTIDACVGKTAKFVIGSSVPVIGGIVSDCMGTVLATLKSVRNITGNIGVISVTLIALIPIVKTVVYLWSLKLCAGILEPISDKKIVKLINDAAENVLLIFVCLVAVTLLLVVCVYIVLMSGNMVQ